MEKRRRRARREEMAKKKWPSNTWHVGSMIPSCYFFGPAWRAMTTLMSRANSQPSGSAMWPAVHQVSCRGAMLCFLSEVVPIFCSSWQRSSGAWGAAQGWRAAFQRCLGRRAVGSACPGSSAAPRSSQQALARRGGPRATAKGRLLRDRFWPAVSRMPPEAASIRCED
jgi:hypothetical protein